MTSPNDTLFDAVTFGDVGAAKAALAAGADVNFEDGMPVFLSILNGDNVMLEVLRQAGGYCADLGIKKGESQP